MGKKNRMYNDEFRKQAIQLVEQGGRTMAEVVLSEYWIGLKLCGIASIVA